jgi:hypothetical protein
MQCKICGTESKKIFNTQIRNKHSVDYFECPNCLFIQTETPYWLDEAYASEINETDTGLLARNHQFLPKVATLLYFLVGKDKYFVDYGGGYGVFTRLMRDVGFDYYWIDRQCENIHAKGFEWDETRKPDAITLFETFEHFIDPRDEVRKLLATSRTIVFSTTMAPIPAPEPENWWYYGREHGQHTALYRQKTFAYIAQEEKVHYYNFGTLHILTDKAIPKTKLFLLKKGYRFIFPVIKRLMKSKTYSDMLTIIERSQKNESSL